MTPDQERITRELIEYIEEHVKRNAAKVPEHWNGIELRNWIAVIAGTRLVYTMERTRAKAFKNDLLIHNLD